MRFVRIRGEHGRGRAALRRRFVAIAPRGVKAHHVLRQRAAHQLRVHLQLLGAHLLHSHVLGSGASGGLVGDERLGLGTHGLGRYERLRALVTCCEDGCKLIDGELDV